MVVKREMMVDWREINGKDLVLIPKSNGQPRFKRPDWF